MKYSLLHIQPHFIEVKLPHTWGISLGLLDILEGCLDDGIILIPWIWGHDIGIGGSKNNESAELTFQRAKYIRLGTFHDDTEKALLFRAVKQLITFIEGRN